MQGLEEGFASPHYAREELRAEISSMMTGDRLRIGHDPSRHAAYVGSWIEALKDDPREIYRASQDAQLMSDWVLDRAREKGQKREAESAVERDMDATRDTPEPFRPRQEQPGFRRPPFQREVAGPSR